MSKRVADMTLGEREKKREDSKRRYEANRERVLEGQKRYREANPERFREYERKRWNNPARKEYMHARHIRDTYGMTKDEYVELLRLQGGVCAVCRTALARGKHTHIDHDHVTKEIRGFLCRACNQAEGHIKKSGLTPSQFAERLQNYLDNPPARIAELIV